MRRRKWMNLVLLFWGAIVLTSCGGGGETGSGTDLKLGLAPDANLPGFVRAALVPVDTATTESGWQITTIDLPVSVSWAVAINAAGMVAGNLIDSAGAVHAFLWQGDAVRVLQAHSWAGGLNDRGELVGWRKTDFGEEAFLLLGDELLPITANDVAGKAYDINAHGAVVGSLEFQPRQGFVATDSGIVSVDLPGESFARKIADDGTVLLQDIAPDNANAYLLNSTGVVTLKRGSFTHLFGRDLDVTHQVVGWGYTGDGVRHPLHWRDGDVEDMSPLLPEGAEGGMAVAINRAGEILVQVRYSGGRHGNLLVKEDAVVDLGTFAGADALALDLNDQGQVAGWIKDETGGRQAFVAQPWVE